MNRAINIINMIKDDFIASEFNELVNGYFDIQYINIIEGESIVHPLFMKLLKIIGYGYYEDASSYIKGDFNMKKVSKNIPENEARIVLATKYDLQLSTIEITNLLIFFLNVYCDHHKNIQPYQLISRIADNNNIIRTKKSLRTKILYYLRISSLKEELVVNHTNVVIMALLSKKSVGEITNKIVKDYIEGDEENGSKRVLSRM